MGITSHSISLIEKALESGTIKNVIELGAQNLYDKDYSERNINHPGAGYAQPYANEYYESKGIEYHCIDLNGENGANVFDLSTPIESDLTFDLVTDFGTGEHVKDPYMVFKNIHTLLKTGGICIRENPKTGNWKGHGCNYMTTDIYRKILGIMGYNQIALGEHPAMGNEVDGWNVYCIYIKVYDMEFMSRKQFNELNIPSE